VLRKEAATDPQPGGGAFQFVVSKSYAAGLEIATRRR